MGGAALMPYYPRRGLRINSSSQVGVCLIFWLKISDFRMVDFAI